MNLHLRSIIAVFSMLLAASPMAGATDLIINGDFENGTKGQLGLAGSLASWTSGSVPSGGSALNFLLDTTYAQAPFNATFMMPPITTSKTLAGPNNGNSNGFTGSPNGGNFLGAQVGSFVGPFSQTVNGLTVGTDYELKFEWAIASLTDATLNIIGGWNIDFGGSQASTATKSISAKAFSGWDYYNYTFTAANSSQTLTFQPIGNAAGGFALLDSVQLREVIPVPEPSTYALGAVAMGVMAALARRRKAAGR